jgi:hypothetical protein
LEDLTILKMGLLAATIDGLGEQQGHQLALPQRNAINVSALLEQSDVDMN